MEESLKAFIRRTRRTKASRLAARAAERFLNAWNNTGFYDFEKNGEAFALRTAAAVLGDRIKSVWDVGAHEGHYAAAVHRIIPHAQVISFEILPPIADRLREREFDPAWFTLKQVGLSDAPGQVDVTWNHEHDSCNSITPRMDSEWFDAVELEVVTCPVTTIDTLVNEGAPAPDILKIDVEGHEAWVLDGAAGTLNSESAPLLIQFEYGDTWIPGQRTLHGVQTKLERAGYSVGRLFPDHVAFKAYDFADEKFRMGNMIAVRDEGLKNALS